MCRGCQFGAATTLCRWFRLRSAEVVHYLHVRSVEKPPCAEKEECLMSSRGDPPDDPDGPRLGRIFMLEGPVFDAWIAPDGGAVKLSVRAMKMQARWLRRARPRPFGFAPGSAHPAPERIEEAHGAGTLSSGVATVLGFCTPVQTMSIRYGDPADPLAPVTEVISDFHRDYQDRDLEGSLLDAARKWAGRAAAPDPVAEDRPVGGPRAEIISAISDVVVSGRRRPVSVLRLADCSAFQVAEEGVLVTILARHLGPELPDIARLTDLDPMLSALEHPDRELIAAALAERRHRHIEQMRNQTRTAHDLTQLPGLEGGACHIGVPWSSPLNGGRDQPWRLRTAVEATVDLGRL
jgi:hypothetical protein